MDILVALAALFGTGADARAVQPCSNTWLVVGRTVQHRRAYAAIYPASIVIYAPLPHRTGTAISDPTLRKELTLAGHRVSVVEDKRGLARALETEGVDLVLTDAADVSAISRLAAAFPPQPTVLGVVYEPRPGEPEARQADCQRRLRTARGTERYLGAIDDVMQARAGQKK